MPINIHLINPNTTASMTEQMITSAKVAAHSDTVLVGHTPEHGPASIESHFDEAMSVVGVADKVLLADKQGADAIVLACFGDPNIWAMRELTDKPVIGIAHAAFIMASVLCTRFAIVTSLQRTVVIAQHLLEQYGYTKLCPQVLAVDLPVLALEDEVATQAIITECITARDNGAGAIVLGCGGMSHLTGIISQAVGVPIVDGVQSAVTLAQGIANLGLHTSKQGDLAYPISKPFVGDLKRFGQSA